MTMRIGVAGLTWVHGLVLAGLLVSEAAAAQPVYRCDGPGGAGTRTYSQQPCADGRGRVVQTDDARTDAQRQIAAADMTRQRRVADRLERERLARPVSGMVAARIDSRGVASADTPSPEKAKARRKVGARAADFRAAPAPARAPSKSEAGLARG